MLPDGDAVEDPVLARRVVEARPDGDALARAVMLARVAAALFGDAPPVTVGRYRLQRQLGRGGGGSVFVAEDPELHREVAVKLIRCGSQRHRERALAEARALAKLSHPNVVPMHDVGEAAEHVYLVMELLRGESLRAYAADRTRAVRELVGAYRQAAAGLAAAHAAGLVHRDFKPDNAMFGDDGRLRVVDFGLAIDAGTGDAAAAGTPRYMAPEQRAGAGSDAAVDQYALAVALREAMTGGGRAEPAWLARVLDRATAEDPARRYPSLDALARALGDDPRRRWSRRALLASPAVLAVIGFGVGRGTTTSNSDTCGGGEQALAPAWTPGRGEAAAAHLERLGTPLALAIAPQVRARTRELGEGWLAAHRRSCTAHARGELSDQLYDRATVCLARSRIGLGEALRLLETATDAELDAASGALAAADRAERCADPIQLAREAAPQPTPAMHAIDQQIEAAAVHARASTSRAIELADRAVAAARADGDRKLLARALLVQGHACMASEIDRAGEPLHQAMLLAAATGLDDVAVEAFARHAFVQARRTGGDPARALDGFELAQALGERAAERGAFARALLFNNAGSLAATAGDFPRARDAFRRALALGRQVTGPDSVELVTVLSNLATISPDRAERRRLFEESLVRLRRMVGPEHSQTLAKELIARLDDDDPARMVGELRTLCPRLARLHPALRSQIELCAFELAWEALAIGDGDAALAAARLGHAGDARPGPRQQLLGAYLAITEHRAPPVAELAALARAQADEVAKAGWYQHVYAADAELALASAARATGDPVTRHAAARRAREHIEQALAATQWPRGALQRRLAWARALERDAP